MFISSLHTIIDQRPPCRSSQVNGQENYEQGTHRSNKASNQFEISDLELFRCRVLSSRWMRPSNMINMKNPHGCCFEPLGPLALTRHSQRSLQSTDSPSPDPSPSGVLFPRRVFANSSQKVTLLPWRTVSVSKIPRYPESTPVSSG